MSIRSHLKRWSVPLGVGVGTAALAIHTSGVTTFLVGIGGILGVIIHEVIHGIAAVSRGHDGVTFGWDKIGPYVDYGSDIDIAVHLAPTAFAITTAALLTGIGGWGPLNEFAIKAACLTTIGFAPLDWRVSVGHILGALQRTASQ